MSPLNPDSGAPPTPRRVTPAPRRCHGLHRLVGAGVLFLLALLLYPTAALAQFNGTSGIFALNHMSFGIMNTPSPVPSGGSGYSVNDTVTMDCPNGVYFPVTKPVFTITSAPGGIPSAVSVTNPGIATQIPSTGLAGGLNGVCTLVQLSSSGSGVGLTISRTFGFAGSSVNGSLANTTIFSLNDTWTGLNTFSPAAPAWASFTTQNDSINPKPR